MKDDRIYLEHILQCIDRVRTYTSDGKAAFLADTRTQDAVIRNLQVIAESTQRLSDPLRQAHPDVDWRGLAGFRNIMVHNYFGIRLERVWEIIELFVPQLGEQARRMHDELPD